MYKELIVALRCAAVYPNEHCEHEKCKYYIEINSMFGKCNKEKMMIDAAEALGKSVWMG